ncbi:MAG: CPBP family intramembrane metalloprotease [Oscillospiraceae bacterium]|nr:CPBP family intramembrane metalloprotease [Oscillospiraceae bacterium]
MKQLFRSKELRTACILFYVILYIIWALKELVLQPFLTQYIAENSVPMIILSDWILKNLFWTLPAVLLIQKFDTDLYLSKKELFQKLSGWKEILPVFGYVTGFCVLSSVVSHRGFYFNADGLTECLTFVFVGITEEFVFRGFLLNATFTEDNKYLSLGLNALLFLCIHFPIWILYGNFIAYFANFGFITIILLGLFFSWSMLKFRNIWIPVGLHMLWDILVTLLN